MAALLLPVISRLRFERRSPFDPDAWPSYRLLGVMGALIVAVAWALGFAGDRHDLPVVLTVLGLLVLLALAARGRGFARAATAIEAGVLIALATIAAACLSMLVGTTALPYRDAGLERADALLVPGCRWIDMFEALRGRAALITLMCRVYQTLQWQPFALAALLALCGRERRCWQFVRAWFLALIACVAIFPFVPAVGAYVHHGLVPADIPALTVDTAWRQLEVLAQVRDGSLRALDPARMTGLVSFPSFHAAGAVLLFWGFRRVPVIGPAFMALDVAMCGTAPLIGAHYFTDIAGGIGIALLAIAAVRPAPSFPGAELVSPPLSA